MPYPDDEILSLRSRVSKLGDRIRELEAKIKELEKKEECSICGVEVPAGTGLGVSTPISEWTDRSKPRPIKIRPLCVKHIVFELMANYGGDE